MPVLPRPTPTEKVRELTRRLAEDYATVPLPEIARIVKEAAATATGEGEWTGTADGLTWFVEVIEQVAREDLDALGPTACADTPPAPSPGAGPGVTPSRARVRPGATGSAPREARRNGQQRGAASRG